MKHTPLNRVTDALGLGGFLLSIVWELARHPRRSSTPRVHRV